MTMSNMNGMYGVCIQETWKVGAYVLWILDGARTRRLKMTLLSRQHSDEASRKESNATTENNSATVSHCKRSLFTNNTRSEPDAAHTVQPCSPSCTLRNNPNWTSSWSVRAKVSCMTDHEEWHRHGNITCIKKRVRSHKQQRRVHIHWMSCACMTTDTTLEAASRALLRWQTGMRQEVRPAHQWLHWLALTLPGFAHHACPSTCRVMAVSEKDGPAPTRGNLDLGPSQALLQPKSARHWSLVRPTINLGATDYQCAVAASHHLHRQDSTTGIDRECHEKQNRIQLSLSLET
jgi:hypothetical protein